MLHSPGKVNPMYDISHEIYGNMVCRVHMKFCYSFLICDTAWGLIAINKLHVTDERDPSQTSTHDCEVKFQIMRPHSQKSVHAGETFSKFCFQEPPPPPVHKIRHAWFRNPPPLSFQTPSPKFLPFFGVVIYFGHGGRLTATGSDSYRWLFSKIPIKFKGNVESYRWLFSKMHL